MKKTAYLILCSALASTLFGVEQIPHQKDCGSLVYVAAHDSSRRTRPTADRPTSMTDLGFGYFDTDLNKMVWRTETSWSE